MSGSYLCIWVSVLSKHGRVRLGYSAETNQCCTPQALMFDNLISTMYMTCLTAVKHIVVSLRGFETSLYQGAQQEIGKTGKRRRHRFQESIHHKSGAASAWMTQNHIWSPSSGTDKSNQLGSDTDIFCPLELFFIFFIFSALLDLHR